MYCATLGWDRIHTNRRGEEDARSVPRVHPNSRCLATCERNPYGSTRGAQGVVVYSVHSMHSMNLYKVILDRNDFVVTKGVKMTLKTR